MTHESTHVNVVTLLTLLGYRCFPMCGVRPPDHGLKRQKRACLIGLLQQSVLG